MLSKIHTILLAALAVGNVVANPVAEVTNESLQKAVIISRGNFDKCAAETIQSSKTECLPKEGNSLKIEGNCRVYTTNRSDCLGARQEVTQRNECVKREFRGIEIIC